MRQLFKRQRSVIDLYFTVRSFLFTSYRTIGVCFITLIVTGPSTVDSVGYEVISRCRHVGSTFNVDE